MYVCMYYVCMCLCMYMYIYTYIHTHIHTYIHTYTHTHNALDLTYQDRPFFYNLEAFEDLCLGAAVKDLRHVTESHEPTERHHLELYPHVQRFSDLLCPVILCKLTEAIRRISGPPCLRDLSKWDVNVKKWAEAESGCYKGQDIWKSVSCWWNSFRVISHSSLRCNLAPVRRSPRTTRGQQLADCYCNNPPPKPRHRTSTWPEIHVRTEYLNAAGILQISGRFSNYCLRVSKFLLANNGAVP